MTPSDRSGTSDRPAPSDRASTSDRSGTSDLSGTPVARPGSSDVPDEIVRSIYIAASTDTVFDIVSEPGWFINDGTYREHTIESDGTTARVTDPVHGTFEIEIVELVAPHRAVFRWLGGDSGAVEDTPQNTVTFTIEPIEDGVILTVTETGFASLDTDAADRRRRFDENSTGWEKELLVAHERARALL